MTSRRCWWVPAVNSGLFYRVWVRKIRIGFRYAYLCRKHVLSGQHTFRFKWRNKKGGGGDSIEGHCGWFELLRHLRISTSFCGCCDMRLHLLLSQIYVALATRFLQTVALTRGLNEISITEKVHFIFFYLCLSC